MGIFDIFKSKEQDQPKSPAEEHLIKAQEHFSQGAYQEALRALAWGFQKDVDYISLYDLSAKCLEKLGAQEEVALFVNAIQNPGSFEVFNNLGTHFYGVGHYDLARPFLEKAIAIDPAKLDTVHDLAIVYARRFQIEKAVNVLADSGPHNDFWNYWFWCKLSILAGDTRGVKEGLDQLAAALDRESDQEEVALPRQKVEEAQEILNRYETVENPETHIRDWHYIQYGGIILDFFEEPEEYVAGGRYVASWGTMESIKLMAFRLKEYISALGIQIENVAYMDSRDAKIVGLSIGMELGVNTQEYNASQENRNTLIVAGHTYEFDQSQELSVVTNGQVLFALNHDWLNAASISPDIVGSMNQTYSFPWNGGGIRVVDAEKGITEETKPDEREESEIAEEIFSLQVDEAISRDHLEFYVSRKDYLKPIGSKVNIQRFNFMIESPVPGSYFG